MNYYRNVQKLAPQKWCVAGGPPAHFGTCLHILHFQNIDMRPTFWARAGLLICGTIEYLQLMDEVYFSK